MIKKLFLLTSIYFYSLTIIGQVGINTKDPHPSSILDVYTENKGVLFPRVALESSTDTETIANPAKGLLVYNTGDGNLKTEGCLAWNGVGSIYNWHKPIA